MDTVNANREPSKVESGWVFLAEYSLDEFMGLEEGGDLPAAGMRIQEPGIFQCIIPMNQILAEIAQQARLIALSGTPAVIRLYIQEKIIKAGNQAETIRPKLTFASPDILLQTESKMAGGWGYFLVKKSASSSGSPRYQIDLFLYKEGV